MRRKDAFCVAALLFVLLACSETIEVVPGPAIASDSFAIAEVGGQLAVAYMASDAEVKWARTTNTRGVWELTALPNTILGGVNSALDLTVVNANPAVLFRDHFDAYALARAQDPSGFTWMTWNPIVGGTAFPVPGSGVGALGGGLSEPVALISRSSSVTNHTLQRFEATDTNGASWPVAPQDVMLSAAAEHGSVIVAGGVPGYFFAEAGAQLYYSSDGDPASVVFGAHTAASRGRGGATQSIAVATVDKIFFVKSEDFAGTMWTSTEVWSGIDIGTSIALEQFEDRWHIVFIDTGGHVRYTRSDDLTGSSWSSPPLFLSEGDITGQIHLAAAGGRLRFVARSGSNLHYQEILRELSFEAGDIVEVAPNAVIGQDVLDAVVNMAFTFQIALFPGERLSISGASSVTVESIGTSAPGGLTIENCDAVTIGGVHQYDGAFEIASAETCTFDSTCDLTVNDADVSIFCQSVQISSSLLHVANSVPTTPVALTINATTLLGPGTRPALQLSNANIVVSDADMRLIGTYEIPFGSATVSAVSVVGTTISAFNSDIYIEGTATEAMVVINNHGVQWTASNVVALGTSTFELVGNGGTTGVERSYGVLIQSTPNNITCDGDIVIRGESTLLNCIGVFTTGGIDLTIVSRHGNVNITGSASHPSGTIRGIFMEGVPLSSQLIEAVEGSVFLHGFGDSGDACTGILLNDNTGRTFRAANRFEVTGHAHTCQVMKGISSFNNFTFSGNAPSSTVEMHGSCEISGAVSVSIGMELRTAIVAFENCARVTLTGASGGGIGGATWDVRILDASISCPLAELQIESNSTGDAGATGFGVYSNGEITAHNLSITAYAEKGSTSRAIDLTNDVSSASDIVLHASCNGGECIYISGALAALSGNVLLTAVPFGGSASTTNNLVEVLSDVFAAGNFECRFEVVAPLFAIDRLLYLQSNPSVSVGGSFKVFHQIPPSVSGTTMGGVEVVSSAVTCGDDIAIHSLAFSSGCSAVPAIEIWDSVLSAFDITLNGTATMCGTTGVQLTEVDCTSGGHLDISGTGSDDGVALIGMGFLGGAQVSLVGESLSLDDDNDEHSGLLVESQMISLLSPSSLILRGTGSHAFGVVLRDSELHCNGAHLEIQGVGAGGHSGIEKISSDIFYPGSVDISADADAASAAALYSAEDLFLSTSSDGTSVVMVTAGPLNDVIVVDGKITAFATMFCNIQGNVSCVDLELEAGDYTAALGPAVAVQGELTIGEIIGASLLGEFSAETLQCRAQHSTIGGVIEAVEVFFGGDLTIVGDLDVTMESFFAANEGTVTSFSEQRSAAYLNLRCTNALERCLVATGKNLMFQGHVLTTFCSFIVDEALSSTTLTMIDSVLTGSGHVTALLVSLEGCELQPAVFSEGVLVNDIGCLSFSDVLQLDNETVITCEVSAGELQPCHTHDEISVSQLAGHVDVEVVLLHPMDTGAGFSAIISADLDASSARSFTVEPMKSGEVTWERSLHGTASYQIHISSKQMHPSSPMEDGHGGEEEGGTKGGEEMGGEGSGGNGGHRTGATEATEEEEKPHMGNLVGNDHSPDPSSGGMYEDKSFFADPPRVGDHHSESSAEEYLLGGRHDDEFVEIEDAQIILEFDDERFTSGEEFVGELVGTPLSVVAGGSMNVMQDTGALEVTESEILFAFGDGVDLYVGLEDGQGFLDEAPLEAAVLSIVPTLLRTSSADAPVLFPGSLAEYEVAQEQSAFGVTTAFRFTEEAGSEIVYVSTILSTAKEVSYGGATVKLAPGAVKSSVSITNWRFQSAEETLEFELGFTTASMGQLVRHIPGDVYQQFIVADESGLLTTVGVFTFAFVDGNAQSIDFRVELNRGQAGQHALVLAFPFFEDSLQYDPDFSVLLSGGGGGSSPYSSPIPWLSLAFFVLAVLCAFAVMGICSIQKVRNSVIKTDNVQELRKLRKERQRVDNPDPPQV